MVGCNLHIWNNGAFLSLLHLLALLFILKALYSQSSLFKKEKSISFLSALNKFTASLSWESSYLRKNLECNISNGYS